MQQLAALALLLSTEAALALVAEPQPPALHLVSLGLGSIVTLRYHSSSL
jgi:hypothetical protein